MNYTSNGSIDIIDADEMNIPVCCFLCEPDEESPKWRWSASNFMPRKGYINEGSYNLEADSKEVLLELVRKHVVPLYQAALDKLSKTGTLYYWKQSEEAINS